MKKHLYFLLITFALSTVTCAQIIEGTFAIKNMQTGMLLRIKDANDKNGTPLVAYPPTNWKCMTWDFKHIDSNTYQLKNLFTGKTFQTSSAQQKDSALLQQQPLNVNQLNQLYDFVQIGKNVYYIKQKGTTLYITPSDNDGVTNTGIGLQKMNGSKLQQWIIYPQKPTM